LDSSNYATYVKTRANDGIVLRYGDYDYSGGAASDEITVDYGPIVDGDFWGTQGSSGLWATHSLSGNINNVIHVFKSGVTFKPNGTQVAAWMDGANNQTAYRLYGIDSSFNGTQLVEWASGTVTNNQLYSQTASNSTFFPAFSITWSSANGGNSCSTNRMSFDGTMKSTTTIANATGTLISDTQTAPTATTKMSGVILYKDNEGTATLGTDLVISLSANGGTNWTEAASYGTVTPLFSTGVKMVRLGETTVTSGTAPVIKAVWANQESTTLETQLHGWAMNY
jgi:hypothetical protein